MNTESTPPPTTVELTSPIEIALTARLATLLNAHHAAHGAGNNQASSEFATSVFELVWLARHLAIRLDPKFDDIPPCPTPYPL